MTEGVKCHRNPVSTPCNIHCRFFEDNLACPFRTPREFWGERGELNLCDFCQEKDHACRFVGTATTDRKTRNIVACFGFRRKEEEGEK